MRPKRILLITSNFPRWEGDSTTPFVLHLAEDLQKEGWQVDVLAPHAVGAARVETLNGVHVRRFRYLLPETQQTVCYEGGALINLREHRTNWMKVPFLVLAESLATLRLLARRKYSITNAHWILPQGFVGAVAGILTGTPLVITVHGGDVFDLQGGLLSKLKAWSLRRAQAVTVNSSATREAVASLSRSTPTSTIPMGVDIPEQVDADAVAAIRNTHRSGSGPLLLFAGRLVVEKGIDDLLHAMASIQQDMPESSLIIAGTGQDKPRLERLMTELGLQDCTSFVGWVDPARVSDYMAAADIFVGPSKRSASGWKEGLGLVFLESMAAGTPVVATASGGIPDIVVDTQTGLLVAEDSPDEIAAAITRLHRNPTLASQLVDNGRSLVERGYTRRTSAGAFAQLFDEIRLKSS